MKFVADSGLWTVGPAPEGVPLTSVLEVRGAVLSWTVDEPGADAYITFTDPEQADWLWRILGEAGHSSVVPALQAAAPIGEMEVADVDIVPGSLDSLRRLALGQWLRRWWPASLRDGIAELDGALLDAEIALLTAAAEDFFGDDGTFDSDVAGLLRPHVDALNSLARQGDPRVVELVRACAELAEDTGVAFIDTGSLVEVGRRDDYALAAGSDGAAGHREAIATGLGSMKWSAVPQGVFDAAEDTVDWRIEADGAVVRAVVQTDVSGPGSPAGIAVRVRAGGISGAGALDAAGTATLELFEDGLGPATETAAWGHDWRGIEVSVGADVDESQRMRDRARAYARARLLRPAADAFLAEVIAAESDY